MTCKVEGCDKPVRYSGLGICQMHYFRKMRNGHYGLKDHREPGTPRPRKYRYVEKRRGYSYVCEPGHPLADPRGRVREHRFVYFEQINSNPTKCALCETDISWQTLHIDHIDSNPRNNAPENLRAVCRGCNVYRAHTPESMGKHFLEIDGVRMTAQAWSRMPGVSISGHQILVRKKAGYSDYDAVYAPKRTHKTKKAKHVAGKCDRLRGISR